MVKLANPLDSRQYQRLNTAIERSRRFLKPFRDKRMEFLHSFVGFNYSDSGARDPQPINLVELAVNIYIRQLAASAPSVLVTAKDKEQMPKAAAFTQALSQLFEEINLADSLQLWALEALSSVGILKCGITSSDMHEVDGYLHDAGQAFVDPVSLDDWVQDMSVKRFEQMQYMGDRFCRSWDFVRTSGLYNEDAVRRLTPHKDTLDPFTGERREHYLSIGQEGYDDAQFEETVELWDIYLPKDNLMVTMSPHVQDKPLAIVEWDGPEEGPFHFLSFQKVPGQTMPLPPRSIWMDLHELVNKLYRKLARQAGRQKTVAVVQGGADADGQRILKADDGDMVRVDRPESTREAKYGGVDRENMAFFADAVERYMMMTGNLQALGGLGPQSGTLGQDELLTSSASQRLEGMQQTTITATTKLCKHLAYYEQTDPIRERVITREIKGAGKLTLTTHWTPEMREGDYIYDFTIEPFSMQHQSPGQKLMAIGSIFDRFIAPYLADMQMQGVTVNYDFLTDTISKYAALPELKSILITQPVMPEGEPQGESRASQSPNTTRTQVRKSEANNSPQKNAQSTIRGFLDGGGGGGGGVKSMTEGS